MDEIVFCLTGITVVAFTFGVLGIIADHILPHWKWLNRLMDSIYDKQDDGGSNHDL